MKKWVPVSIEKCSGCSACMATCPKKAIKIVKNREGFRYPVIDAKLCIDCKKCQHVCPWITPQEGNSPKACYGGWSKNQEVRITSSSGGIFYELARYILDNDGVVFGAGWTDDFQVKHFSIQNIADLPKLQSSKYVESDVGNTFQEAKAFLADQRKVLYVGTPCQIAGLKQFLGNEKDDNLICVDFACHGVPSHHLLKKCVRVMEKKQHARVEKINMRYKEGNDWKKYKMKVDFDNQSNITQYHAKTRFFKIYLADNALRYSCYNCICSKESRYSDITLADFWGVEQVHPDLKDIENGTSAILINTSIGASFFSLVQSQIESFQTTFEDIYIGNPQLKAPLGELPYKRRFFYFALSLLPLSIIRTLFVRM